MAGLWSNRPKSGHSLLFLLDETKLLAILHANTPCWDEQVTTVKALSHIVNCRFSALEPKTPYSSKVRPQKSQLKIGSEKYSDAKGLGLCSISLGVWKHLMKTWTYAYSFHSCFWSETTSTCVCAVGGKLCEYANLMTSSFSSRKHWNWAKIRKNNSVFIFLKIRGAAGLRTNMADFQFS